MSETQPSIDFLILADHAEAVHGKLYLMGGGWDVLAPPPGGRAPFSLALGILVPWLATNADHPCRITLESPDGQQLLDLGFNVRTGRPPSIDAGATQRVIAALPVSVAFPTTGPYVLTARIGADERRAGFQVRLPPGPAPAPPQP